MTASFVFEFLYGDGLQALEKAQLEHQTTNGACENLAFQIAQLHRFLGHHAASWRDHFSTVTGLERRNPLGPCRPADWTMPPLEREGEPLILLGEQGIGDQIRWSHYLKKTKARSVSLIAEPKLVPLLTACLPGQTIVPYCPEALAQKGDRLALGDLDGYYWDAIHNPQPSGFLELPDDIMATGKNRLDAAIRQVKRQGAGAPAGHTIIGLCFRSMKKDPFRSLHYSEAEDWAAFFSEYDGYVVNLQYGLQPEELAFLSYLSNGRFITIENLNLVSDLVGYASIISVLDGVVGASTMCADLAAALGVQTWRIMPESYDTDHPIHPWYGAHTTLVHYTLSKGKETNWQQVLGGLAVKVNRTLRAPVIKDSA